MPGWAWAAFAGWAAVSVVVGLLLGRVIRLRDAQVPHDAPTGEERN